MSYNFECMACKKKVFIVIDAWCDHSFKIKVGYIFIEAQLYSCTNEACEKAISQRASDLSESLATSVALFLT